jgi:hypothetical protein
MIESKAPHLTAECLAEVGWWSWTACRDRSDKAVLILYKDYWYAKLQQQLAVVSLLKLRGAKGLG